MAPKKLFSGYRLLDVRDDNQMVVTLALLVALAEEFKTLNLENTLIVLIGMKK